MANGYWITGKWKNSASRPLYKSWLEVHAGRVVKSKHPRAKVVYKIVGLDAISSGYAHAKLQRVDNGAIVHKSLGYVEDGMVDVARQNKK